MKTIAKSPEKVKLDQIMKVLFKLSKKVMVNLLNGLFNENFNSDKVTIDYGNPEFITDDLGRIVGDLFITIRQKNYFYRYHIEFQTANDQTMVIRMFRYGFEKALEINELDPKEEIRLDFPRQLVIFLEENKNIKERLFMILKLPDQSEIKYTVPIMKYWEYTIEELTKRKMYALLPLQVFKARKKIMTVYTGNKSETEKAQLITLELEKLLDTIKHTLKILEELHQKNELVIYDLEKILMVITNITEYLYNKYGQYKHVKKEVYQMITTLYNPLIKEEGEREGRIKGEREGKIKGEREGKIKGKREGKIEDILELLEEYGELSAALKARIQSETEMETIKRWHKFAAKVSSIDEFVLKMNS